MAALAEFKGEISMYKKIKTCLLPVCISALLLCGCSQTENTETATAAETVLSAEESADITEASADITEDITGEAEVIAAEKYIPSDEERAQIQELLTKSKEFFYGYIACKDICQHTNQSHSVTTTETIDNGMYEGQTAEKTWYEVSDGEVMSLDALNEKMDSLFTENMIGSLDGVLKKLYHEENGRLYIADYAGSDGGVLGTDTVHIASVGKADENTLVLYMTAFGAGENWDLDHDLNEDFTVVLKNTDSGLKIDVCDFVAYQYIEWCYAPKDDIFE